MNSFTSFRGFKLILCQFVEIYRITLMKTYIEIRQRGR